MLCYICWAGKGQKEEEPPPTCPPAAAADDTSTAQASTSLSVCASLACLAPRAPKGHTPPPNQKQTHNTQLHTHQHPKRGAAGEVRRGEKCFTTTKPGRGGCAYYYKGHIMRGGGERSYEFPCTCMAWAGGRSVGLLPCLLT